MTVRAASIQLPGEAPRAGAPRRASTGAAPAREKRIGATSPLQPPKRRRG